MRDRVTVEIPGDIHREFKLETVRRDIPMKEATAEAIRLWIKSKPGAKAKLQPA